LYSVNIESIKDAIFLYRIGLSSINGHRVLFVSDAVSHFDRKMHVPVLVMHHTFSYI
jgi:hypothetical protein